MKLIPIQSVTFSEEPQREITYSGCDTILQGLDTVLRLETSLGIYWYDFTIRNYNEDRYTYGALYDGSNIQHTSLVTNPHFREAMRQGLKNYVEINANEIRVHKTLIIICTYLEDFHPTNSIASRYY